VSRVRVQIMKQFERKSHEYKDIKRYWKLIQQDSRKLSDKRFYRPTFRMHLTNKEPEKCFGLIEDNLKEFILFFRLSLKPSSKIKKRLSTPFSYPILMPN